MDRQKLKTFYFIQEDNIKHKPQNIIYKMNDTTQTHAKQGAKQGAKRIVPPSKKTITLCNNCGSSKSDPKYNTDILFTKCHFCSQWCAQDYETEVRQNYLRAVSQATSSTVAKTLL